MTEAIIGRWGRTLAIRLPVEAARKLALGEGGRVEVEVEGDAIVMRKAATDRALEAIFAGKSPREWCEFYRDAWDWGPDLGRETIEE